jgi:hypothetical protein
MEGAKKHAGAAAVLGSGIAAIPCASFLCDLMKVEAGETTTLREAPRGSSEAVPTALLLLLRAGRLSSLAD